MKAVLKTLLVLALFFSYAYGQSASTPPSNESEKTSSSPGIMADRNQVTPTENTQGVPDAEMHFPIFRTLGGMGLVLCLMIGIYFAAKKYAPRYFAKANSEKHLRVIETLSMGDRRSISLIEVGDSRFLMGNTPHQINLLAALPEPLSLASEPDVISTNPKGKLKSESSSPFQNLFDVEKRNRPQYRGNPLPEDIRTKMRQLRDSLER
jgi:flagellar biosynthetic protein FliO